MKEKVLEAYDKLARDYEKHVDTESGFNAYYERPAMMKLCQAICINVRSWMPVVPQDGIRSNS